MINLLLGGLSYLRSNPLYLLRAARNATRLEMTIPLDLLRWAIDKRPRGKGPERIEIGAADPAMHIELTVDLFGTKLDVSADIRIDDLVNDAESFKLALRVQNLALRAPEGTPAAQMVAAMDLSQPANLLGMMPGKHTKMLEASGDRIVVDLMMLPAFKKNQRLRQVLAGVSFVGVKDVRIDGDVLVIGFAVHPLGIPQALSRARRA